MTAVRPRSLVVGAVAALLVVLGSAPAGAQSGPTLSPGRLDFGSVTVGQSGPSRTLTFTSPNRVPLNSVTVTGEFIRTGGSCAPGIVTTCTVDVAFAPKTEGAQAGAVVVVYNADSTVRSALTGTGVPVTTTTVATTTTLPPTTTVPLTTTTAAPAATTTTVPVSTTVETTTTAVPETATTTTTAPPRPPPASSGVTLDAIAADGGRSGPPGIGITVTGSGYPTGGPAVQLAAPPLAQIPASCPTVYVFLDGRRVGSTRPDAAGQIRKTGLSVPGDEEPGRHQLTSSCRASGSPALATSSFDVTEATVHRNALATSLPRVDQVGFGLDRVLISALAVAALLVLIAFPAELFNTTLEAHYNEVRGWFRLRPRSLGGGRHHGALLALFLLLSGPLWFAMQPSSGPDVATALGALGLSLATAVVVIASDLGEVLHVRRRYHERAIPIALPGSLVIAVACVVLSRAVGFQPGYFYGLLGGLALSRTLGRDESGRVAARTVAFLLLLSIGSWVALQPVSAAAAESGRTLGAIMVENLLGGIFWCALDSLVIAMLPLRLLEGAKVVGWSRAAWAALYGVTLLAFVHILLRPSTGYVSNTSVSPPALVIGMFFGFAAFSFAFWGYFRFRPASDPEALPDEVEGAAGAVPGDVLVAQGVGAGEVDRGPVGTVETAVDGPVGGEVGQPEDRDAI